MREGANHKRKICSLGLLKANSRPLSPRGAISYLGSVRLTYCIGPERCSQAG